MIALWGNVVTLFSCVIQKCSKFTVFTEIYFSHLTVFKNKLHNFTQFGILFLAVLLNFSYLKVHLETNDWNDQLSSFDLRELDEITILITIIKFI